jgi:hypothetical protein
MIQRGNGASFLLKPLLELGIIGEILRKDLDVSALIQNR